MVNERRPANLGMAMPLILPTAQFKKFTKQEKGLNILKMRCGVSAVGSSSDGAA